MDKPPTKFDKLNLFATVIGPLLICGVIAWAVWSVNIRFKSEMDNIKQYNADTYVTKPWFQAYHDETIKKIDTLTIDVGQVKEHVAHIDGELAAKPK